MDKKNKTTENIKPKLSKKALISIIAGAAVVAVAAVVLVIVLLAGGSDDNNYMATLDLHLDMLKAKTYDDYVNATIKSTNGLLDDKIEAYYNIMSKTTPGKLEKDHFEDTVLFKESLYGADYTFYYETEDLEKIEKSALKSAETQIKDLAKMLKVSIDETKKNQDELGVSNAEAKKLIKAMESICKTLESPRVTEGYELTFVVYVEGSELDKPEMHIVTTVEIFKIDGKWVSLDSLDNLEMVFNQEQFY